MQYFYWRGDSAPAGFELTTFDIQNAPFVYTVNFFMVQGQRLFFYFLHNNAHYSKDKSKVYQLNVGEQ